MKRRRATRKVASANTIKTRQTTDSNSQRVVEEGAASQSLSAQTSQNEGTLSEVGHSDDSMTPIERDHDSGDVNMADPIESAGKTDGQETVNQSQEEEEEGSNMAEVPNDAGGEVEDSEVWTPEREDKLIDLFRSCVFLYDKTAPGFLQRHKKDLAMAKFAKILGVTGMYPMSNIFDQVSIAQKIYSICLLIHTDVSG